jgi:poly(3-hydroxybutyrate) depolymerase
LLYHFHEFQNAVAAPLRIAAEANQMFLRHPMNPLAYTQSGRAMAAASELVEAGLRPYAKPEFGLATTTIDGVEVAVHEKIVLQEPFCDLLHFKRDAKRDDPKLLIVAPQSGHFATLLRGTVEAMLPDHEVYITDWIDARDVPMSDGEFDLDDYIDYIITFLEHLGPNTHIMAVCQPSVPAMAAVALMSAGKNPALPASMTLMGGPIDTRIRPTQPNDFAQDHSIEWFEQHLVNRVPAIYPGFMRKVYPGFLQLSGFMAMNLDRHVNAHFQHFNNLVDGDGESADAHRTFYDEYRAVMDLPAPYYLQTVKRVFQDHDLPRGEFRYRGNKIDLTAISQTALMTVEGEKDDISAVGQTEAAHHICPNIPKGKRGHYVQAGVGHYGVFNGRRWREEIAPRVKKFIRAQSKKSGK